VHAIRYLGWKTIPELLKNHYRQKLKKYKLLLTIKKEKYQIFLKSMYGFIKFPEYVD
jgi:hypothetical protein